MFLLLEQNSRSIESIVTMEMDKFYADKTGRTDFALEATGELCI